MLTAQRRARVLSGAVVGAAVVLAVAGCSTTPDNVRTGGTPLIAEGALGPASGPGPALSYDPALAPVGASMRVEFRPDGGGTRAILTVRGFLPNRGYAAHGHVNPCGPTGDAAGPHFQQNPDPVGSYMTSTDPAYVNPSNEMWLDLRTDASGSGTATTQVPWTIGNRGPKSVVIHDGMQTMTGPGVAGTAGGRAACLTVSPTGGGIVSDE